MADNRYFGSDLNKWIHENLRKDMVVINIDCFIIDKKLRRMLLIESKYPGEKMGGGQRYALQILAKMMAHGADRSDWKIDVVRVDGEPPYDRIEVKSFMFPKPKPDIYTGEDVKRYLELEDML
jgi:hypothetical protein